MWHTYTYTLLEQENVDLLYGSKEMENLETLPKKSRFTLSFKPGRYYYSDLMFMLAIVS